METDYISTAPLECLLLNEYRITAHNRQWSVARI